MDNLKNFRRTNYCGDLRLGDTGKTVSLCGWVQRQRDLGGLIFVDLRDRTGLIQLSFDDGTDQAVFEKASSLRSEYVIAATGTVRERESKTDKIATGAIEVNGETLSNMKATFVQGTTYVPASLLSKLDGYSAQVKGSDVTITTPNGDELVSLARSIIDKVEMGASIKLDAAGMEESYNIPADCFTEAIGFFPMIVSADTIVIGKVADGKMDDAKAALEAQRALTQQNFEQYLPAVSYTHLRAHET